MLALISSILISGMQRSRVRQASASRSDSLWYRSGLYKPAFFPMPIAGEVSGIIVELPTDQALLESETYKSRGFKKGGKVALVLFHDIARLSEAYRIILITCL